MNFESLESRKLLTVPTGTNPAIEYLTRMAISIDFDHDVSGSLATTDLQLANISTAPDLLVSASNMTLVYPGGAATAVFKFNNGTFTNGNYRAILSREDVSNGADLMAEDVVWDNAVAAENFFFLAGDANRDRTVDINDLAALASHMNLPGDWSQGDFNYDEVVDINDLATLATNWQTYLPEHPQGPNEAEVSYLANGNSLLVEWDQSSAPAGTTEWRIQRSTNGVDFSIYADVDVSADHFVDDGDDDPAETGPGLSDGTRFYYRVRPLSSSVQTTYTPKRGGTVPLPAPTVNTPTALSSRKLKITWTDNSQNETDFIVYRSPHGANTWDDIATVSGAAADEYIDTNLSINTTYDYYVTAKNALIESGPSTFVDGTTMTLTADMTTTVGSLIDGKTPSAGSYDLYSSIDDATATYVRNSSIWATGIDLTCLPVWNSFWQDLTGWSAADNGVLITSRHLVQAKHFGLAFAGDRGPMPPGATLRFVTNDNVVIERTVADNNPNDNSGGQDLLGTYGPNERNGIVVGTGDIRIIELTNDLPSTITPAKVFPSTISSLLPNLSAGVPVAFTNKARQLRIGLWNSYAQDSIVVSAPAQNSPYSGWHSSIAAGDSSSGIFSIVNNTPVVLGTWWTLGGAASNLAPSFNSINSAIASTGKSLTAFYLS